MVGTRNIRAYVSAVVKVWTCNATPVAAAATKAQPLLSIEYNGAGGDISLVPELVPPEIGDDAERRMSSLDGGFVIQYDKYLAAVLMRQREAGTIIASVTNLQPQLPPERPLFPPHVSKRQLIQPFG